jgi:hypothetical protein
MKKALDGEFLIQDRTPDYEHDGDNNHHIQYLKDELDDAGVSLDGLRFSWYTENDEDGEEGIVTIRGAKAREKQVLSVMCTLS